MFTKPEHRIAGHAAAAKSEKTPAHLRIHQERLATMGKGKVQKNIPLQKTAPLGTPESSLEQPQVSTPVTQTKVRFYQKPVPTVGGKPVGNPPKQPASTGRVSPKRKFTHAPGNKVDWSAPKSPTPLGRTKKLAAIYGG